MKAFGVLLVGILFVVNTFAQGTVNFLNDSQSYLTTNSTANPPPGQFPNQVGRTTSVGQYRIGLYIAPQGTTDPNAFTLMGPTAANQSGIGDGRVNGNPGSIVGTFVISNNTGLTIAFQVRAWSASMGATWEAASSSPVYSGYLGVSAIGQVTPAMSGVGPDLFGTSAGQVGGITLLPGPVPEPSSAWLALLGAALGCGIFRFRSRCQ
jgi:hypothetical protein